MGATTNDGDGEQSAVDLFPVPRFTCPARCLPPPRYRLTPYADDVVVIWANVMLIGAMFIIAPRTFVTLL